MRAPYTRARLNELRYGVGYTFGNDEIIELAEKHTASPLSLSLPTASLSFTLYNEEGRFSVEGGTALQRFLAEGQDVPLSYGQTLEDVLLRFAQDDGSFAHTPEDGGNLLATTQAFYALTALQRARDGKPTLYDMSDVTP